MSNKTLGASDQLLDYILQTGVKESTLAKRVRDETKKLAMGKMQIAPEQGAFMAFVAKLINAKAYLEIGVFTGYSMLSVVSAMGKESCAVGCDISREWTDMAKSYWKEAGIEKQIELRLQKAEQTLSGLDDLSFDLVFIDADKENYDLYYEESLRVLKRNGVLMIDNIFWGGSVYDERVEDKETRAIRALNTKIMGDRRVDASMLTLGDGLMLVRKL